MHTHTHTHTPVVMVTINSLLRIRMSLSLAFIHVHVLLTMVTIVIHECIYMFIIMNIVRLPTYDEIITDHLDISDVRYELHDCFILSSIH